MMVGKVLMWCDSRIMVLDSTDREVYVCYEAFGGTGAVACVGDGFSLIGWKRGELGLGRGYDGWIVVHATRSDGQILKIETDKREIIEGLLT